MTMIVLQYLMLENLLAEAERMKGLRVHVLEQSQSRSSPMLTWREITIGLGVRGFASEERLLSWYGQVGQVAGQPGYGATTPEQEQYRAIWQTARALQTELVTWLRQEQYAVYTDGLIELPLTHFLRGNTRLIWLPDGHYAEGESV